MKIITNIITNNEKEKIKDFVISFNNKDKTFISIDCSSTNTGVCIMDYDGNIKVTYAFKRETGEDKILYKVLLKENIKKIMEYANIDTLVYEKPFISNPNATETLYSLQTIPDEIKYENVAFNNLAIIKPANSQWKKHFFYPDKKPMGGTKVEKEFIKEKVLATFPTLVELTQDEYDAIGMGIGYIKSNFTIGLKKDKIVKDRVRTFDFVGANSDEEMLEKIKQPTIQIYENNKIKIIEDTIKELCTGEEQYVIKYERKYNGHIALKYHLSKIINNKFIYIYVHKGGKKVVL